MILTTEEYARGFIDFDAVLPKDCIIELWTRTADTQEENSEWTGPYSKPDGSKVLALPKPYMQLQVQLKRGDDPTKTPVLAKVRWERDGNTYIWPGQNGFVGPPGPLSLGRDYGISYRLVFQPKRAVWPDPFVIISKTMRIRFWKGGLKGHDISGFKDAQLGPNDTLSIEGSIKEVEAKGDIVEILATIAENPENSKEQTKEAAKNQVESVVGLLALCFGEQILGNPIFAEYYFSSAAGEQGHIHIPVKHLIELSIEQNLGSVIEEPLSTLYRSSMSPSIRIALRWYAAGLNSGSLIDAYISYFVSLEALATGYFAAITPKLVRKEYNQLKKYFSVARPSIDRRLKEITLGRIADFPLSSKFEEYWRSRFVHKTRESSEFPKLNRIRNDLLHGSARFVATNELSVVKGLVERLLAKELGLESIISNRQSGPKLLELVLTYLTVPSKDRTNQ